ncbi:hypothetical protein L1987_49211 [Smallanthus sonchifolius]|uniref:Uncharacterized protein n=1 Tax=Smallanthus sonchifolius TaxID=185202 RepID=A0ACB9FU47_9ASTR|nr:hypothetical protein L1987_49211 [Smallanthus sonchifolius]
MGSACDEQKKQLLRGSISADDWTSIVVRLFRESTRIVVHGENTSIQATVAGHQISITQNLINNSLQLNDLDGVGEYSQRRLIPCFQQIGYDEAPIKVNSRRAYYLLSGVPSTVELFDYMVGLADDVDLPTSLVSARTSSSEHSDDSSSDDEDNGSNGDDLMDIADGASSHSERSPNNVVIPTHSGYVYTSEPKHERVDFWVPFRLDEVVK